MGIQQSGIEDSVPEKIRKTSMDNLKLFMDEEDKKTVDSFYEEAGDNLVLKDDVKSDERDVLNDILAKPMMIAASFSSVKGFLLFSSAITVSNIFLISLVETSSPWSFFIDSEKKSFINFVP